MTKPKPELWVCLYDIHYPQYDRKTFRSILTFIRKNEVHGLLLGGDALDLSCVSHWNKDLPGNKRKGELKSDLDGFEREILRPLEALLPRDCEKVFLVGNHERTLEQDLSETMPELDGMIDFKQYLRLAERGFKVIPLGGDYEIGELLCIHFALGVPQVYVTGSGPRRHFSSRARRDLTDPAVSSNGAKGYIRKQNANTDLLPAIEAALRGDRFVSSGFGLSVL